MNRDDHDFSFPRKWIAVTVLLPHQPDYSYINRSPTQERIIIKTVSTRPN